MGARPLVFQPSHRFVITFGSQPPPWPGTAPRAARQRSPGVLDPTSVQRVPRRLHSRNSAHDVRDRTGETHPNSEPSAANPSRLPVTACGQGLGTTLASRPSPCRRRASIAKHSRSQYEPPGNSPPTDAAPPFPELRKTKICRRMGLSSNVHAFFMMSDANMRGYLSVMLVTLRSRAR